MISMKSSQPIKVDIGWLGVIPNDNRKPGESNGHYTFFVECMSCDRWYDHHLLKCDSEEELVKLYGLYYKRLLGILPFKMYDEDFIKIAENTWKDADYQSARSKKIKKGASLAGEDI